MNTDMTTDSEEHRRVILGARRPNGEYLVYMMGAGVELAPIGYICRASKGVAWQLHIDGVYWRPAKNPATGEPVRGKPHVSNTRGGSTGTTRNSRAAAYDLAAQTVREHWDAVLAFSTRREDKYRKTETEPLVTEPLVIDGVDAALLATMERHRLRDEARSIVIEAARALADVLPVGVAYCNAKEVGLLRAALAAYDEAKS